MQAQHFNTLTVYNRNLEVIEDGLQIRVRNYRGEPVKGALIGIQPVNKKGKSERSFSKVDGTLFDRFSGGDVWLTVSKPGYLREKIYLDPSQVPHNFYVVLGTGKCSWYYSVSAACPKGQRIPFIPPKDLVVVKLKRSQSKSISFPSVDDIEVPELKLDSDQQMGDFLPGCSRSSDLKDVSLAAYNRSGFMRQGLQQLGVIPESGLGKLRQKYPDLEFMPVISVGEHHIRTVENVITGQVNPQVSFDEFSKVVEGHGFTIAYPKEAFEEGNHVRLVGASDWGLEIVEQGKILVESGMFRALSHGVSGSSAQQ